MATEVVPFLDALSSSGFVVSIHAELDDTPVRGNAMASGDDAEDRACEDEIIRRANNGDVWAWASVEVRVTHPNVPEIEGRDFLGCCCYADEADFRASGYLADMARDALRDWFDACPDIEDLADAMESARAIL